MDERNGIGTVDSYLASLNSTLNRDEGLFSDNVLSKTDKYVETTIDTGDNFPAEYEATKIIKCRRYKLYYKNGEQ